MSKRNKSRVSLTPSRCESPKGSTPALGAATPGLTGSRPIRTAGAESGTAGGCPPEVRAALSGPWPSISTPFTRQGVIDFDALYNYLDFLIEEGKAKAVVLTWGDSLYSLLTDDEIAQVTKVVAQHVNRRAYVVAADNQWWAGKTVAFGKYCVEVGADALMVLPPDWAASTTIDSLVAHYAAIAKHIRVMMVTNYLQPRGIPFSLELVERLCREVPGVVAMKEDMTGEFARKACLVAQEHWAISAGGQKQDHMNMFPYGADGYLSTFIQFEPEVAWYLSILMQNEPRIVKSSPVFSCLLNPANVKPHRNCSLLVDLGKISH